MTAPLEVIVFCPKGKTILSRAQADTPEAIVYAGQILHDEAAPRTMGAAPLQVGFFTDGKLVRMIEGRP